MPRLATHWKILIGLALGLLIGLLINEFWTEQTWAGLRVNDAAAFIANKPAEANADASFLAHSVRFISNANKLVGDLFMRGLRFIAVPIVLFSLIVGAAQLGDLRRVGRVGGKALGIFLVTTAVAVTIGLVLANVLRPGEFVSAQTRAALEAARAAEVAQRVGQRGDVPTLWAQILDLVPANPFQALASANMLQVIVFALAVGVGLTMLPAAKAQPVIAVCDAMTEVMVKIVRGVMFIAPVAVLCLIAPVMANMGLEALRALSVYCMVLVVGLALVCFVHYPLWVLFVARISPIRFFRALAPAQLLAFSSSSSSATLPVTMSCVRDRLGVSERITSFVCPLGATVNMDGTALYQGVATVFIAQMAAIPLSIGDQLTVVLTATLASIGTPGIPGAGVVLLVIVLESVGVPPAGIAVILGVDRLLDMFRTVVNVTGDAMVSAVVARSEGESLAEPASQAS